jgi:hypothetical protein
MRHATRSRPASTVHQLRWRGAALRGGSQRARQGVTGISFRREAGPLRDRRHGQRTGAHQGAQGNGKFDVLEVWGHIYKADYRMRFIYAQIKDSCTLMGEEILEASDPY